MSKAPKCCYEEQELVHSALQDVMSSNFLDGFVPNNPCNSLLKAEELCSEFKVPQLPQGGSSDLQCEKKANERIISAQSIAARERRRKITEKTQELGKLVPGGPKMNTAEMLHAAASMLSTFKHKLKCFNL
ncbi:Myc-type, basic helix-loop-helix [Sesbania bispinosa]|nr:Myc-type, basic helix-loop-helix [Sesbania bispinosa]